MAEDLDADVEASLQQYRLLSEVTAECRLKCATGCTKSKAERLASSGRPSNNLTLMLPFTGNIAGT